MLANSGDCHDRFVEVGMKVDMKIGIIRHE